jgi:hypothetical protein
MNAETSTAPKLGNRYRACDLPAGSVVSTTTRTEYVIGRSGCCMRWEQPIPGSETWLVRYEGRLPLGVWMTHRERAEVDEGRERRLCQFDGTGDAR